MFFADYGNNTVYRVRTSGQSLEAVITTVASPRSVAVYTTGDDTAFIFVTSDADGSIYRAQLDGSGLTLWKAVDDVRGVAAVPSTGHVYYVAGGAVYRASLDGDNVETIQDGFIEPVGVTVKPGVLRDDGAADDDDGAAATVFVADAGAGTIYALTGNTTTAVVQTDSPRSICLRSRS